ncbi:MAG: hypothetical protein GWP19_11080 [Planctomycetia bacterium]|nr:hypothetical protein [Planctomycetia bacterium]
MKNELEKIPFRLKRDGVYTDEHHWFGSKTHKKSKRPDKPISKRDISDLYSLTVFLKHGDHLYEVEPKRKQYAEYFCNKLGLDFIKINLIMNTNRCDWELSSNNFHYYMDSIKRYMNKLKENNNGNTL